MKLQNSEAAVQLSPDAFRINGKSELLLCASLFYFRIPRALWKERLCQLKAFGYNCIDVYFPWNFHEMEEGVWDFTGEKDAEQFLRDAAEAGLWVIARPGPYICSEWDGGALPAYLFVKDNLRIRDNDPHFLQHVSRWYDQILLILRENSIDQQGSIIAVQLENELDFYPCNDPKGYISALRDMALQHGVTVPLIACAGQGGLEAASGFAEGVIPTCNFYPNDQDPSFEEKVLIYRDELHERGLPLLVTETNRSHFLLRRLLSCGVKLLGPYLQASGTNFGFTNATNNWGNPLSFLTSDYDFHGMITPEGHIREEAYEGRLLSNVIQAYGSSLAESIPDSSEHSHYRLTLKQGGQLIFLCNVTEQDDEVFLQNADTSFPRYTKLASKPNRCPILPLNVPLQTWGIEDGMVLYATAEISIVKHLSDRTVVVLHAEHESEISLKFSEEIEIVSGNMTIHESTDQLTVSYSPEGKDANILIRLSNSVLLELVGLSRSKALSLERIDEAGNFHFGRMAAEPSVSQDVTARWAQSLINPIVALTNESIHLGDRADNLEKHGVYRGYAWYESRVTIPSDKCYKGLLLERASDVVSLYADDTYIGTMTPAGGSQFIPVPTGLSMEPKLTARTEIWGHSNFHDIRLPSLELTALKGLTSITAVTNIIDISQNWRVKALRVGEPFAPYADPSYADRSWPIASCGGWLNTDLPSYECYRKEVVTSKDADSWVLHLNGKFSHAHVYVNGQPVGKLTPLQPYADLTPFASAGETLFIALFSEKTYESPSGRILIYEGNSAKAWRLSSAKETELLKHAEAAKDAAFAVDGSVELKPGQMSWLYGELCDDNEGRGWRVYIAGANMKLTVFFNGHLVGRLWTKGGTSRPVFRGGNDESFYLPGPWFRPSGNEMIILLEAVALNEDAHIESLSFVPVAGAEGGYV
ncbi:beta-galactosidase [Paenibacillus sedimenti]|uniref:Beta-galactosidase n=1 Tax=Paenibacillus sedimenti TaxID=2770274 RepID=A0A926QGY9_9BACL|nr:beta-galactosidase [Paenibacillus sedimenti]MBD0378940.1 beta-galactosidase [Paenibacillus sedimenti]